MKAIAILAMILLFAINCNSQGNANAQHARIKSSSDYVPGQPYYPGGVDSLLQFIHSNTRLPDSVNNLNISGKVYVSFIVDTLGNVRDIQLLKGMNKGIDEAVMRAVSIIKWEPAVLNGVKREVKIALPVVVNTGQINE